MNERILESIKEAAQWLVKVRKDGQWQDLVYKKQGIINTAEAWHTLATTKQVLTNFKLPGDLFEQDLDYLAKEIKKRGFLRTPYQPDEQRQSSTDVAAFIILALAQMDKTRGEALIEKAVRWLLKNKYPEGGWSWGFLDEKYPMYPYFTYMDAILTDECKVLLDSLLASEREKGSTLLSQLRQKDVGKACVFSLTQTPPHQSFGISRNSTFSSKQVF